MARLGRAYPSPVLWRRRSGAYISSVASSTGTAFNTAAHNVGDLIIIIAGRTLSTLPVDPGAPYTTDFSTTGGGVGVRVVHTTATATNDSSGTWTGGTVNEINLNYRGGSGIGAVAFDQATSTAVAFPALTLQRPGQSWLLLWAWQNGSPAFDTNAMPTGFTRRITNLPGTGQVVAMDSGSPVWSAPSVTYTSPVSQQWRTLSIEILI